MAESRWWDWWTSPWWSTEDTPSWKVEAEKSRHVDAKASVPPFEKWYAGCGYPSSINPGIDYSDGDYSYDSENN
eukprot:6989438-Heterocapsa_arctica.AAC.1